MATRRGIPPRGTPFEVVRTLLEEGGMHRAELARHLQTSRPTITNTVTTLLDQGMLEPESLTGETAAGEGKAPLKEKLVLARRAGIIGAAIHQDDSTIVGLGEVDGRVISTRSLPCSSDATGPERISSALTALRELLAELPAPHPQLHGVHVAPNTLVNRYTGEVLGGATSTRWSKVNIRDEYEEGLGTAVVLENLARHAAYAQYGALEGPPPRNLLHVSLSFGVALGQVFDGRIISGAHGGAGELGHVSIDSNGPICRCSHRGCLFNYAGAENVLEESRIVTGTALSLDEAIDLALAGDDRLVSIFSRAGAAVGMALNSVCNLMDPDLILIGGRLSRAGDVVLDPLRDALFRNALPLFGRDLRIEPAATLTDQALVHASLRALRLDVDLAAAVLAAHDPATVAAS
ncbi:hypothetical protein CFK38_15635 [Brachybacterium vulturis]|uniref:HTH marR-type domain-containing protein n=1 Tax=Brachybacterium vulturis TaxID=2017484 RepID=A0A291GRH2_9MICO|nr:ROK family transcriptional regulator [Brachybacterium vulturis]ATG52797.1 hypothetical protein CFK38_15635 [Brachybacterium vulturis]